MRLGDLDALREDFARYTWGPYNPFARIDAAPTIECEACKHFRLTDFSNSCDYCQCGSEFQRRQP